MEQTGKQLMKGLKGRNEAAALCAPGLCCTSRGRTIFSCRLLMQLDMLETLSMAQAILEDSS